jgi:sigma-B regulation protein RsbU (phosphoserine phosphatase)
LFSGLALSERSARGMAGRIHTELGARAAARAQASMWIAFLSPRGDVRSCTAGGPPPLWVPADDSPVQRIGAGGPPLGSADDPETYVEESFRLLPGDLLVAVSDGVLDMRDPTDAPFGPRAVADLVAQHRRDALDRLIGCILGAVDEHARQAQPADDQVVLAIRYTAGR